jgi:hypothetical protein
MDLGRVAGFTGPRDGLTSFQRVNLLGLLVELRPREARHGDCVGADAEMHLLCAALGVRVRIHPPDVDRHRAFCHFFVPGCVDEVCDPKPYLVRDHDIVDNSDYLVATPKGAEVVRSGTWATVRYARELRLPVFLLHPDGRVDRPRGAY